ncbi:SUMF1/EgtB/PvdO family nonheme iron enzyme [Xenorhabdus sp. DI]|uniref:formylglycine-generating enzyme family protein n=1 Tax=Xenorhabdus doucetiae TaxID=351671 RepID=UPI0019A53673|nr:MULTISPECIES: SUMF1/EgtB/PvdO family nonheme iron enzyme [unclassified Xenorhabdus]MBD2784939.1 SUMF1/EgtB/PvdO family nonheme iron enzyme [Xenorhabdus sp. 3]MBD2789212.1 SUMF1/EgtB/PvdO family nonheme iron enzyme [Xenorhabdus sp. DI]
MDIKHFHSPNHLVKASPDLTDRKLLGLAEHYTPSRNLQLNLEEFRQLAGVDIDNLVEILESKNYPLEYRYTAGKLLSYIGDPRLDPLTPTMIEIPGGNIYIGLSAENLDSTIDALADLNLDREWIVKEVPRHQVHLNPYRIGKYPVTNLEYMTFLKDSGENRLPDTWFLGRYPFEIANHPVDGITAEDADCYTKWLSEKTKRFFRLPSEAEWEYAAAGPDNLQFPWGGQFLPDYANTAESGIFTTTPVGMFSCGASPFGCLDMAGNVEEYVAEDYEAYPKGISVQDDLVNTQGKYRVARGGSYSRFRDLARNTRRHGKFPRAIYIMGFRLAESFCS